MLNKANKAEKTIKSTGLSMNVEVPPPPHPSNRDRYILWRKRNSVKHVIPQTKAVSFLTREGYTLDKDYEAYQAIDLANEIRKKKGLPLETEDETIYFKNVFTNKDKNIYRKRSMVKSGTRQRNESLSTSPSNSSLDSIEKLENSKYLRGGTKIFDVKSRTSTLPALPVHTEEPIMNVVASAPPAVQSPRSSRSSRSNRSSSQDKLIQNLKYLIKKVRLLFKLVFKHQHPNHFLCLKNSLN